MTKIEENKWDKQDDADYHVFTAGGGLEIPQDTGESKFIGIQMRFEKFLLLGVFALFCSSQASLLLNSPEKK